MRYTFFFFLLLVFLSSAQGQTSTDSIVSALNKYNLGLPQEKIYVHTDRQYYTLGDTLWFKIYLVKGSNHTADLASKNLYVDLLSKRSGKVSSHLILKNEGGFSHGYLPLSDSVTTGAYEIRAYTNWMRNFPDHYFFHKDIYVLEEWPKGHQDANLETEIDDLQFFSEGGNLVADLENRVAFKAVDKSGHGVDFDGLIISGKEDTITTIQSLHSGMGSFIFSPELGEKYYCIVKQQGSARQFQLPLAQSLGYSLYVDNVSDPAVVKVIAQNNFTNKDLPILIVQQRGRVVFSFQNKTEDNYFAWALPKKNFIDNGIVQLTLFNRKGVPQCERIIYHSDHRPMQVSLTTDKTEYSPREKVAVSIHVSDENNNPVVGNFSLSATDSQRIPTEPNGSNIVNYLYFTSDVKELMESKVKGKIEEPDYYFNPANKEALNHLDILLMTQGWRRFLWSEVRTNKNLIHLFDIESGIPIGGAVLLKDGQRIQKPINVTLSYFHGTDSIANRKTTTDLFGRFKFSVSDIDGESKIFLREEKGSGDFKLSVDKVVIPDYKPDGGMTDSLFMNLSSSPSTYSLKMNAGENDLKSKLLKTVEIKAKKERPKAEVDTRRALYSGLNIKTVAVDKGLCNGATSILQMLQAQVSGLMVTQAPDGTYVAEVRGHRSFQGPPAYPVVLVDGVPVTFDYLNTMPPCSVESIDVVTTQLAIYNAPGLISILTKSAGSNSDWNTDLGSIPGTLVSKLMGYQVPREFYSPKHGISVTPNEAKKTDNRLTFYWGPIIKTDSQGNAKVVFFNPGNSTTARIALEGISISGKPGCATINYVIK